MEDSFVTSVLVVVSLVLAAILSFVIFQQHKQKLTTRQQKEVEDVSPGLKREQILSSSSNISDMDDKVLNPAVFKTFKILKIIKASHNTKLIRFEIPHGKSLGLPIGRHISIKAEVDGSHVVRAYTPTSRPDQTGFFDLVIKNYDMGKLSPHLHSLKVGNSVSIRGPVGRFRYEKNAFRKIGLVAGGSGLTPCLQLIRCLLQGPDMADDRTSLTLLFQNRTEEDIILRDELDALQAAHAARLHVVYYLSNAQTKEFGGSSRAARAERRGYINQDEVHALLHPDQCQLVCICGPAGFNESVKKLLVAAGHEEDRSIYVW